MITIDINDKYDWFWSIYDFTFKYANLIVPRSYVVFSIISMILFVYKFREVVMFIQNATTNNSNSNLNDDNINITSPKYRNTIEIHRMLLNLKILIFKLLRSMLEPKIV